MSRNRLSSPAGNVTEAQPDLVLVLLGFPLEDPFEDPLDPPPLPPAD